MTAATSETITRRLDFVTERRYGAGATEVVIRPPAADVVAEQADHTEQDFLGDLAKVTRRQGEDEAS